jgi:transmembrane sensor
VTDNASGESGPSPEVLETAAQWFVRLQEGDASAEAFAEWNKWLGASSEHRLAYEELENTILRLERLRHPPQLPSLAQLAADKYDGSAPLDPLGPIQPSAARKLLRNARTALLALAAAVVLMAFGGPWFLSYVTSQPPSGTMNYQTAAAQTKLIELPEGSRVTLDADSELNVVLTSDRRALTLVRGEGYFQVAKDRSRPFVVQAGATQVTAIGTAFNIRRSANRTVVAVLEGKVEFVAEPHSRPDAPASVSGRHDKSQVIAGSPSQSRVPQLSAQVAAGEAVSYSESGDLHALPATEASLAAAWLQGHRRYYNEPLRYVLADVSRYTGRKIKVSDELTGDLQFTGTLDVENSEAWLRGLSVALPVRLVDEKDGTLRVERQ